MTSTLRSLRRRAPEPGTLAELAEAIRRNLERVRAGALATVEETFAIGHNLIAAKAQLPHGQWLPWLEVEFDKSEQWARTLMRGAKLESAVRAQIERQLSIWGSVNFDTAVAAATRTRALLASTSHEWYSPADLVGSARQVLGGIDLDPASCELANATVVHAGRIYTVEDDGLAQEWRGRVWLNPPYDRADAFIPKLVDEYASGRTTAASALVAPRTDTRWFATLFDFPICFVLGRPDFWNAAGVGQRPTAGAVLAYLGPNPDAFQAEFAPYGAVVERRVAGGFR